MRLKHQKYKNYKGTHKQIIYLALVVLVVLVLVLVLVLALQKLVS